MVSITLPELGEEIEKAVVSCWYFKVGDTVNEDDDIVEIATDKATFNVPTTTSGIIREILVKEGEEIKVGETLAIIE